MFILVIHADVMNITFFFTWAIAKLDIVKYKYLKSCLLLGKGALLMF